MMRSCAERIRSLELGNFLVFVQLIPTEKCPGVDVVCEVGDGHVVGGEIRGGRRTDEHAVSPLARQGVLGDLGNN